MSLEKLKEYLDGIGQKDLEVKSKLLLLGISEENIVREVNDLIDEKKGPTFIRFTKLFKTGTKNFKASKFQFISDNYTT